jgi:hypothetical protein
MEQQEIVQSHCFQPFVGQESVAYKIKKFTDLAKSKNINEKCLTVKL